MAFTLTSRSAEERIAIAKEKVEQCLDQVVEAQALRIHADTLVFGDHVRGQIPVSRAGHAYNDLARVLVEAVLLSVVRLWDTPNDHEANLQTIFGLIDDSTVRNLLIKQGGDVYRCPAEIEPATLAEWADENEEATAISLRKVSRLLPLIVASSGLGRARNHRNKHIAHRTSRTRREITLGTPINPPKFVDVDKLLRRTVRCVDLLNLSVRQSSYVFSIAEENARQQAEEFWSHFRWSDAD
jgi:hypothetical protein